MKTCTHTMSDRKVYVLPLYLLRFPHAQNLRRHANSSASIGQVGHHHTSRANLHAIPDAHIAENRRGRADEDAVAQLWMPNLLTHSGTTEGDAVEQ